MIVSEKISIFNLVILVRTNLVVTAAIGSRFTFGNRMSNFVRFLNLLGHLNQFCIFSVFKKDGSVAFVVILGLFFAVMQAWFCVPTSVALAFIRVMIELPKFRIDKVKST